MRKAGNELTSAVSRQCHFRTRSIGRPVWRPRAGPYLPISLLTTSRVTAKYPVPTGSGLSFSPT